MDALESIRRAVAGSDMPSRVGVAFSGGVDSSLVAAVCSDLTDEVTLLTVGFEGSHDLGQAARAACILNLPHRVHVIEQGEFEDAARAVCSGLDTDIISWQENCIAFHFISRLAADLGLDTVVTANGIDELFCGYDSYRRIYHLGPDAINSMIRQKTTNEISMMRAVEDVASGNGVHMAQPLLSPNFVEYSWTVPLHEKVRGPDDLFRKHAIRRAAHETGLPDDISYKRKKALQYGTRIHRSLVKSGIRTRS